MNQAENHRRELARCAGADAHDAGKPLTANPYKKSRWGMGDIWELGWYQAHNADPGNLKRNVCCACAMSIDAAEVTP